MGYSIKDILHGKAKHLLHIETEPGLGCTEPAAIGLCAAAAAALLPSGGIDSIAVETDPNIHKNAMGVTIPNSGGRCGIDLASAMGAAAGDASLGLQVFGPVDRAGLDRALALRDAGKVRVSIADCSGCLYVKTTVTSGKDSAEALIRGEHDKIVSRKLNGSEVSPDAGAGSCGTPRDDSLSELEEWLLGLSLAEMVDVLDELDSDDLAYVRSGLALNTALVEYGLAHGPGIGVGRAQLSLLRRRLLARDAALWAGIRASAGIDSRMGGVALPAMTLAGSGNQGIAAGMPILAAAEYAELEDESVMLRAVSLSYLITCRIKAASGRLSALCGSGVAGGAGVAAGTAYLFGANLEQIGGAIKNHLENFTAVVCDGAKTSCALKVGEMCASAVKTALMAMGGCVVRPIDGIIEASVERTMANVGTIARKGLASMDPAILEIMTNKRP